MLTSTVTRKVLARLNRKYSAAKAGIMSMTSKPSNVSQAYITGAQSYDFSPKPALTTKHLRL